LTILTSLIFRFGLGLEDNFKGSSHYGLTMQFTKTAINSRAVFFSEQRPFSERLTLPMARPSAVTRPLIFISASAFKRKNIKWMSRG
jgi:hypothetical protein